jgi:hypothetical protein
MRHVLAIYAVTANDLVPYPPPLAYARAINSPRCGDGSSKRIPRTELFSGGYYDGA